MQRLGKFAASLIVIFCMATLTYGADVTGTVKGPDGAPFVLDAATKTVYRIDLASRKARAIFRAGAKPTRETGTLPVFGHGFRDLDQAGSIQVRSRTPHGWALARQLSERGRIGQLDRTPSELDQAFVMKAGEEPAHGFGF